MGRHQVNFLEDRMIDLFGGNMSAHGQDTPNGGGMAVREPVTPMLMRSHLQGEVGIGIYPMWHQDDEWWVKWGCCDIDTGDWSEAYRLALALRSMNMRPFIERSRSKGWHVWVFSDGRILAGTMRRALKIAYQAIGLQAREANPKAERLRDGQLGNYVRLPYKGGAQNPDGRRQVMMTGWSEDGDGEPMSVYEFMDGFDDYARVPTQTIEYWASKYIEPSRPVFEPRDVMVPGDLKEVIGGFPQKLREFVTQGPPPGTDRSEALCALAYKLKSQGLTPDGMYAVMDLADRRWGKYADREDRTNYLADIVERTM